MVRHEKRIVYLETSFINRLADPLKREPRTRQEQLDSREWWRIYRAKFTLVTSKASLIECTQYPNKHTVKLRLRYLSKLMSPHLQLSDLNELSVALRTTDRYQPKSYWMRIISLQPRSSGPGFCLPGTKGISQTIQSQPG